MALLTVTAQADLKPIAELARLFPSFNGRYLALIGKRSRTLLKQQFLSGQELTLRAFPTDSRGRNTITSDVNKRRTQMKLYAYPLNLFELGRRLRSGKKEKGKYIITKKLKGVVENKIPSYAMGS